MLFRCSLQPCLSIYLVQDTKAKRLTKASQCSQFSPVLTFFYSRPVKSRKQFIQKYKDLCEKALAYMAELLTPYLLFIYSLLWLLLKLNIQKPDEGEEYGWMGRRRFVFCKFNAECIIYFKKVNLVFHYKECDQNKKISDTGLCFTTFSQ